MSQLGRGIKFVILCTQFKHDTSFKANYQVSEFAFWHTGLSSSFCTLNIFSDSLPSELSQKQSQGKQFWTSSGVHVPPTYSITHASTCRHEGKMHTITLSYFYLTTQILLSSDLKIGLDSLCSCNECWQSSLQVCLDKIASPANPPYLIFYK